MAEAGGKQIELNNRMAAELDKKLDERQFKKLRNYLKGAHGIDDVRAIGRAEYAADLIEELIKAKKIQMDEPDGYKLLIDGLILINEEVLADLVKEYQSKIANAGATMDANERTKIVQSQTNDAT